MAGLGRVDEIWRWPLHYYLAVRREYLKVVGLGAEEKTPSDTVEIAPGVYQTTVARS